jgi:hypothetical protein
MSSQQDLSTLKNAVDRLLNMRATRQLLQLNSNTCERAYEAYVLGLCCEAVRRAGGNTQIRGILSGNNPGTIVFRGAPGSMYSRNQNFAYVSCVLNGKAFEIHLDVEYQGTSGTTHEIDVSICSETQADAVRNTMRIPKATGNTLIMAFECKFYDSSPGVALGRTFVGLISDCGRLRLKGFIANLPSDGLRKYFSKSARPQPFLGLHPLDKNCEERFIRTVEQELRRWT